MQVTLGTVEGRMTLRANLVFPGKSPRNISEKTNILFRILLYYPCIVLIFAYTYNKKDEMGSGPLLGGVNTEGIERTKECV